MQSLGFTESLETHICAVESNIVKVLKKVFQEKKLKLLLPYPVPNTCVYSHLDCVEDSLPEGDMAALFVHMVEVLVQREKLLYTTLGCRLGGSRFCKVRGHMKINGKNI